MQRRRVQGFRSETFRSDAGMTLVEAMVSILLIVIVLAPTTYFVILSQRTGDLEHIRAEAVNLATQALETAQANADAGLLPTGYSSKATSIQEYGSRTTQFTITTAYTTVVQGTSQTVCQAAASVSSQIWQITATVTWNGMTGATPVVQTADIAPGAAGAAQQFDGELAVALTNDGIVSSSASDAYTGTPTLTLTGTWQGAGSAPSVPVGQYTTETQASSGNGCVVFQNLDADSGWVYQLSLAGNPQLVSSDEHSDSNPNGALNVGGIILTPGVLLQKTLVVDNGTSATIAETTGSGSCSAGPALAAPAPAATSSEIPISVQNSFLTAYATNNDTWVAYGANGSVFSSLLLFPWSGATYVWAGSQPYGNPSVYGGTYSACQVSDAPDPATPTPPAGLTAAPDPLYVGLYPLYLTVSGTGTGVAAQEASGDQYRYALNVSGSASATSLPLGEYVLVDSGSGVTVTGGSYVWVTPTGDCVASSVGAPPATCTGGASSPIAVTAS